MRVTIHPKGGRTLKLTEREWNDLKVIAHVPSEDRKLQNSTHPWIDRHTQTWNIHGLIHDLQEAR